MKNPSRVFVGFEFMREQTSLLGGAEAAHSWCPYLGRLLFHCFELRLLF